MRCQLLSSNSEVMQELYIEKSYLLKYEMIVVLSVKRKLEYYLMKLLLASVLGLITKRNKKD